MIEVTCPYNKIKFYIVKDKIVSIEPNDRLSTIKAINHEYDVVESVAEILALMSAEPKEKAKAIEI